MSTATAPSRVGMVAIPGGDFLMGTADGDGFPSDGEGPIRNVRVRPFLMDACAVTNSQFAEFVKATGYTTEAENIGWSFVFHHFASTKIRKKALGSIDGARWWLAIKGASWKRPEGPDSAIGHRGNHPVVHCSWNDAMAYARWASKRLPTEAEWERAARGGLEQAKYPWGDDLTPKGEHRCNIWQGRFPDLNSRDDGFVGTAPARSFPPNGFSLRNIVGNVWEWCADWFSPTWHLDGPRDNPLGPPVGVARVMRGGSYLCHKSYCNRYRVAARSSNTPDSASGNLGFRCVADPS